jgi:hypothetical protein
MRVFWSVVGGFCVCIVSFIIFNALYLERVSGSTAGVAAAIYGAPVALGCGILAAFVIALALRNRSLSGDIPNDRGGSSLK